MKIQLEKLVTPEYLLSHGFYEYNSIEEGDCCDIPFDSEEGWRHFREQIFHRQLCVVLLKKYGKHDNCYRFQVYFQEDVGCGFVEIPYPWMYLSIEHFVGVFYGITNNRPGFLRFKSDAEGDDIDFELVK